MSTISVDPIVFFTILVILAAIYIYLGLQCQVIKTQEDYFLGGRQLGYLPLIITIMATQLGGGTIIGAADNAYSSGWAVILFPLGYALGLGFLAFGFGAKLRNLQIMTIPQIFEKCYDSLWLRRVAAVLSIMSLFLILIAQGIAAKKLFSSLGYNHIGLFIGFWLVIITYTVFGGLRAVVKTDVVQMCFIMGAFVMILVAVFMQDTNNLLMVASNQKINKPIPWFSWLFMPLLFILIEQDMGQRCFAAKNSGIVTKGVVWAALGIVIFSAIPIYLGLLTGKLGIDIPSGASVLITGVGLLTGPTVFSIFICAILMAIISTADSLLCSISSNLSCDFIDFEKTGKKDVFWSKGITFITGLLAMVSCYWFNNVIDMLVFSYELLVSILFVPVLIALIDENCTKRAAIVSMIGGGIGFVIFRFVPIGLPKEFCALLLSALGYYGQNKINKMLRGTK